MIRRALCLFLLLVAACASAAPSAAFVQGNEAYAAGDFAAARRLYHEALAQQPDENAWFNLGNACFRLGETGEAALAYERALALSPGHAAAAENLRFVRQKTGARINERSWMERPFSEVPPAVAPWIAVAVAWLGFAWLGAALWRRTGRGGVIGGLLLVLLGGAYGGGLIWWRSVQRHEAIVVAASADVRSEPSQSARSTASLPAGSRVRLVSSIGGWQYAELANGGRGWFSEKDVQLIIPPRS